MLELPPPSTPPLGLSSRRVALCGGLAALLTWLVTAAARGRVHADEIFQTLEPASRLAFGFGERTWEWTEGIRNWVVPGVVAALLRVGQAAGLHGAMSEETFLWLFGALVHGLGVICLVRLVEERDGASAAWVAGLVLATWGVLAIYGARTLSDSLCLPPLWASLLWQERATRGTPSEGARRGLLAGLLVGASVVVRYGSLVFAAAGLLRLAMARRPPAVLGFLLGLGVAMGALGLLDALTWGGAWHSLLAYWSFNSPQGPVLERFGTRPFGWYIGPLAAMVPLTLAPAFVRGVRRIDGLTLAFPIYLVVVCAHPHKDGRFLLPLVPLWICIAAPDLAKQFEGLSPAKRSLAVAVQLALSFASATVLLPVGLRREEIAAVVACGESAHVGALVANRDGWCQAGDFHLQRDAPVRMMAKPGWSEAEALLMDPAFDCAVVQDQLVSNADLERASFRPFWNEGAYRAWRRELPSKGNPRVSTRILRFGTR